MVTDVVVSKKGEQLLLKELRYMIDKHVALAIEVVEKILGAEMALQRVSEADVTATNYIEALSIVDIRTKLMKDAEVEPA
jgi:hypothetical protein